MIALPGLTLPTGKYDVARSVLRTFAKHVDHGMLPNRFPDAGETPEYNTVDAALWFIEAARAYLAYTDDLEFVRDELYLTFADIISWHVRGTRYGIKVDDGGLLASGEPAVQLTWMDAKVGDWVVTPRLGKPVEIQALWYNALCIMEDLAGRSGDEVAKALSPHGHGCALEFQPALLERRSRLLVRRGKRRLARSIHSSQPHLRSQVAVQHVAPGPGQKGGGES
jgi:predicted glycogen debranching enzyme